MSELVVFADPDEMGSALAAEIAEGIEAAGREGRNYILGCPGGRSPRTTYQALARIVRERALDVSGLVIAMMDDYVIDDGGRFRRIDPAVHCSVERFARDEIIGPLNEAAPPGAGVTPEHLWIPDPQDPASYDDRLRAAGGVDLFILASGDTDGHIAFNPPGSSRQSRTRIITLADSTRRDNLGTFPDFDSLEDVPRFGISIGIATIVEMSHRAVLVAHGDAKREAVRRISSATEFDPDWPSTALTECAHASIYADRQSAPVRHVAHTPARAQTEGNEVHT